MPLHFCHPNTPHRKLGMPEWFVSNLMMDRALDAVVRRAKTLDRKHDIPYLAGYSKDGKTIYIDRHMPSSFRYDGQDINTDRYLILHEEVEKTLIDQLNLHYLHAHQIATRAEQAAVRAAGIRWRDYDRFMQKYVKRIGDERLTQVPADLDLKPYRDEHDYDLVQRMLASVARGQGPHGVKAEDVVAMDNHHSDKGVECRRHRSVHHRPASRPPARAQQEVPRWRTGSPPLLSQSGDSLAAVVACPCACPRTTRRVHRNRMLRSRGRPAYRC
jgi:hypothetical protein